MTSRRTCAPNVTVVGTPDAVTTEVAHALAGADVVAGGKRHLALYAHAIPQGAEQIQLSSDLAGAVARIHAAAEGEVAHIRAAAEGGRQVVVLASGDPLLFGIGATLMRELGRDRVKVVPAASSVQLAFAAAGQPWHDATILSAHGRPLAEIVAPAMAAAKLAILTDDVSTPAAVAAALEAAGMEDCPAVVCERLGGRHERVVRTTLHALRGEDFDRLNILLLFREPADVRLRFGRSDGEFESARGQITKAEVRAVTLSKLRLPTQGVLWDVGAGSGALAIEAAALMPRGTVYAVEKDPEQLACLERNVAKHAAGNVRIIAGEAPEALGALPRPDAIFLGGNGGRLSDLLEVLPRPFVTNLAMLEHVGLVLQRFPNAEVVQLGVARSQPIGEGHRLAALNPVYVMTVPAS